MKNAAKKKKPGVPFDLQAPNRCQFRSVNAEKKTEKQFIGGKRFTR